MYRIPDDFAFQILMGFIVGVFLTVIIFSSSDKVKSGKIALHAIQQCELELVRKQHCKITAVPMEE